MFDWALLVLFALNVTWLKCLVFKTFWCPVYKFCASTNCIKIHVLRFRASVDYMSQSNITQCDTDFEKISIFWDPLWHLERDSFSTWPTLKNYFRTRSLSQELLLSFTSCKYYVHITHDKLILIPLIIDKYISLPRNSIMKKAQTFTNKQWKVHKVFDRRASWWNLPLHKAQKQQRMRLVRYVLILSGYGWPLAGIESYSYINSFQNNYWIHSKSSSTFEVPSFWFSVLQVLLLGMTSYSYATELLEDLITTNKIVQY